MQIKKNKQAITRGVAILGIRMYRISFFIFSGGSGRGKIIKNHKLVISLPIMRVIKLFYSLQG